MRSPVFSPLISLVSRAVTFSSILPDLNRRACWVLTAMAAALLYNGNAANAQTTFTCSAQGGTDCALSVGATQTTASTSSFTVPTAGTISSISIELHGVWADGVTGYSMGAAEFLLTGPGGAFDLLGQTGDTVDGADDGSANSGLHGLNIVIQDGANPAPMACGGVCSGTETNNWPEGNGSSVGNAGTITITVKPGSYFGYDPSNGDNPPLLGVLGDWPDTDGCNPDPILTTYNNASNCSSPTLTTSYGSTTANGPWTLTVQTVSGYSTAISITDWSVTITYSAATPTTTVISSNTNPSNSSNAVAFTATVTSGSGTPTGTVAFTANGVTIPGCGANVLTGGSATCSTTLGQGNNGIEANYTPSGGFGASNATMNQLVEVTPTQSGNTWCNSGQITAPGNSAGIQYPSVINVSGYPAGATVGGNLTVELMNATGPAGVNAYHLLVAPAGQNLDFFDSTFAYQQPSSPVNLTIYDGAGQTPSGSSAPSTGNYDPYDNNQNGVADDTFPSSTSPSVDSNIPQVPGTINRANPLGGTSFTNFQQAFSDAPANGDWALYTYAGGGENESIEGGWCVTLDVNTGVGTTTTVTATPNPQATGQLATLTATVLTQGSNTPVTSGTVTFLDNNAVPAGVTNNTVSLDGNGNAQITTSSLAEGDHPFTATYNGTASDNGSYGTVVQRINDGTTIYAANAAISNGPTCGAAYCYCNGGPVSTTATYKGAFTPNPSILTVTDLPGTIGTVSLGLNQYSSATDILYSLESMVVNPTGADLDFFSNAGYSSGGGTASLGNYLFSDAAGSPIPSSVSTLAPGTYKPSSYPEGDPNWPEPAQPYFLSSSGFYTLPSGITYATSRGNGTFTSQFGNTNPDGIWALYMTEDDPAGAASAAYGWCVNFTENPVTVSVDLSHQGTGTGTDFVQGENGAQITTLVQASNTTGPTGDPLGTNPLTVVDTLNAALTYTGFTGTNWSCTTPPATTVTCTNDMAIVQGGSYPTLTLNVNVSSGAAASLSNGVSVTGAGITGNTGSDTITVDPGTTLSVSKSHTGNFTTGTTGQWSIVVSNTATGGATTGTVNVSDTLPTGYTLASYSSSGSLWTCGGSSNVVTCSATPGIAGGSSSTVTLTVNVPSNSPTSVSNTALAWGGGDAVHTSQATAATSNTDSATVDSAPAITSASSSTFTLGTSGSFTVTASGNPAPTFTETGALPSGVTLSTSGVLSGTPAAGSGGTYPLTITAANGTSPNATQSFTLTVVGPPAITSANSATFTAGAAGAFTVTTNGSPTPALNESGALPTGVTFIDNGNGTATVSGTATLAGSYPITITAQNGTLPNATQSFTLAVNPGPATNLVIPGGPEPFYTAFGFNIYAYDANNNLATSYNGTVAFTSSDPGFVNLGPVTLVNGVGSQSAVLKTAGVDTITATDVANPSITGTGSFTIQPGAATRIGLVAPASTYAGSPISVTLTAYDLYGNVATSYGGTVVFTSSDPVALLPGSSTITNGTGTFTAYMETAGSQTITATDALNSLAATSGSISVTIPALVVTTAADDTGTASNCTIQATPGTGTDASCSLRDALLLAANQGSASITFDSTKFASATTITLANGTLNIPSNTTILGPTTGSGASLTNLVTIDGGGSSNNSPVFTTTSSAINDGIQNLVITDGGDSGIYNGYAATLTVQNSTVSGNSSTAGTSGIFNDYNASLTVVGSTISGNSGAYGAIVSEPGGSVSVTDSTISGNTASNNGGGGILSGGTSVTVSNSTITGNSAYGGGGILIDAGTLTLTDSIVAGNTAQTTDPDINGAATDGGGNVIGDGTGLTGITNGTNGDQVGTSASPLNPLLAALANYGGPTKTMIPLPGSMSICALNPSPVTGTDQRGYPRTTPYGGTPCQDSGAVQTNYALSFTTEPTSPEGSGQPFPVAVTLTEQTNTFTAASESIPVTLSSGATLSGSPVSSTSAGVANYSLTVTNATPVTGLMLTAALTLNSPIAISATSSSFDLAEVAPIVTALSPTLGPAAGGTTVTITGTNFTGASSVRFGVVAATAFTVVNPSTITATSPAGTGTVDVTVTTPEGTSVTSAADQFTFIALPALTGVSPSSGPVAGGTTVTITGTNFNGATAVKFGTTSATSFTVISPTSISATAPAGTGTVDVTATTVGGTSATTAADQYFYVVSATTTASPISAAAGTAFSGQVATFTDNAGEVYPVVSFTATINWGDGSTAAGTVAQPGGVGTAYIVTGNHTYAIGGLYTFTVTVTPALGTPAPGTNTATVSQVPAITSASSATFAVGTAGSFTVTASGYPAPTFSKTGALPTGVTLSSGGVLSGTPAAGTGGVYTFTITASNGNSPNATQTFTLTVDQAPAITSAAGATFTTGTAGVFHVTSSGYPTSALTETGSLPSGVTFVDNGNGTAFLSGTPAAGTGGSYSITIKVANGVSPNAQQSFTLTVDQAPSITSASGTTFTLGSPGTFTVTTTGFPAPGLTETGALPGGVNFVDNGDGTATLAGTPAAGGIFPITITAANGFGTNATQSFTLTVIYPVAVTANPISPVAEAPYTSIVGSFNVANNRATLATFSATINWGDGTISAAIITQPGGPGTAYLVTGTHTYAASGTFTFTVAVTPALGPVGTATNTATVAPAPATHFLVTAPTSANVGGAFNFTVTALDAFNNPTTGYFGTAHFTSTDPVAMLPADATLINGAGTFSATLNTQGSQTITATDAVASSITGTTGAISVSIPSLVVENTNDSGAGSLRASLASAASAGSGNITFNPTAFATAQTITLTSGTLNIPSNTTITGPTTGGGATLTNLVTVDGGGSSSNFSILNVNSGVTSAAISNLIMTDGYINSQGGAIANAGTLTVTNCTLSNNYAGGYATGGGNGGGAIYNDGTLTITGGTLSGNTSAPGGAIVVDSGSVTISGSTISGNTALDNKAGGAIFVNNNGATVTIANSTISGNTSSAGDAVFNYGTLTATNSIIAGNTGGDCGSGNGSTCPANGSNGNIVGVTGINLAPLGNYGGSTQTMISLPGSPAICAINPSAATGTDQRGFPRTTTYGATTCQDSGAAETNYALSFTTEPAATENSGQAFPAAVTLSESGSAFTAASESIPVTLSGSATLEGSPVSASTSTGVASYSLTVTNPTAATGLQLIASLSLNGSAAVTASSNAFNLNSPIATTTMVASNLTVPWSANSQNVTLVVDVTASGNTVNSGVLTIPRFVAVITPSGTTYRTVPVSVVFSGSPATFTLSLPGGLTVGTYTLPVSYSDPSDVFAPSSDSSHTLTVGHAATTTTVSNASVTYSATAQNVTLSATVTSLAGTVNAGTVTFTVLQGSTPIGTAITSGTVSDGTSSGSYTLPAGTAAGTYTIQAVYNGTATFATSTDSTHTLIVNTAATTTAASNATATYSANTQSVTLAATVTSPSGPVNSGTVTFTVLQGSTPIGIPVTSATVSNGSANVSYALPAGTAVETYAIQAVYSGTASLLTSSDSTHTLTIRKATATVTLGNLTQTYTGGPISVTATTIPPGLTVNITYNGSPNPPTSAGSYTVVGTISNANYTGSATGTLKITQAAPSITWATPAAITYGTALSSIQLDASATFNGNNVAGAFAYSPAAGTVLTAGPHTLSVTFTPTDTTDYTTATQTVQIIVNQSKPSITWATPAAINYGTALSSTQLDAAATFNGNSVAGAFAYSPAAGTVLTAGPHTLSVTFTPTDTTDYTTATQTVQINVTQATPTITWATPAAITYGTALSTTQLDASATFKGNNVAGTFAYSPAAGTVLTAGPHTLSVTFTPTDTTDYTTATQTTTITVTGAVLTITANNATRVYGTANPAFSGSVTGQQNGDTFTESFTTAATISSPVNSYAIVPSVTGVNLADYTQSIVDGTLTITKAGSTTKLGTSSGSITPGQSVTLAAQVSSDTTGTPTGTVSFYDGTVLLDAVPLTAGVASYSTAALAPGITHSLSATYNGDTNFNSSSSTSSVAVVVAPLNFTMTLSGPSTATVVPGGSFTYQVTVTPDYGVYSGTVNFTVAGLPPGATASFSPSSIAANGGQQTITITIQTAPATAMQQSSPPATGRNLAPFALAFLVLFGVGTMRKRGRSFRRMVAVVLLLAGGAAATLLSGCGSKNGFFAQQPQSYAITITATSTTIQKSVTVNLNVE